MTREKAIEILNAMARDLAVEFGYTKLKYRDTSFGIWDTQSFRKYMTDTYGKLEEYQMHNSDDFRSDIMTGDYIEFRYMFDTPCLSIHKDGNTHMGELQIGGSSDGDYHVAGIHCFSEQGIEWGNKLYQMFKEYEKKEM